MTNRPKKRNVLPKSETTNSFLEALKFIGLVTKEIGPVNETHVYLNNGYATAFNGTIAAGHKVAEEIYACPNNKLLIEALSKCGENLSITQLDHGRLSIKSDKFKAIIPCIDPTLITLATPDDPIAIIDDRFKEALATVGILATEDGQTLLDASILMAEGSLIAVRNRGILFEAWHGIHLPTNLPLPKAIVKPLTTTTKKLARFGFSQSSATFWFEDDSWLKTQFYAGEWPDILKVMNKQCNARPIPPDFFTGLAAVTPFSEDGWVRFNAGGRLSSHDNEGVGASFEVPGLPGGVVYNAKQLALLKPWATSIDFIAPGPHEGTKMVMAYGDTVRGAITSRG